MTKCQTKKWKITNIAKNIDQFELIDLYKDTILKEFKARKDMVKDLTSFKKWYFLYLKACELDDKVEIIWREYYDLETKTEEQKDWLQEANRAKSIISENLPDACIVDIIRDNEKKVREFTESEDLKKYKIKIYQDFIEGSEHYLNKQNSIIVDEIGGIDPLIDIYDAICCGMQADTIYDKDGKPFIKPRWIELGTHKDSEVRKDSYIAYYKPIAERRHAFTSIMYYIAFRMNQQAKYRKYRNEIAWKAEDYYHISLRDYYYIIDQCEKFASINVAFTKFNNELIACAYGLHKIEPWETLIKIKDTFEKTTIDECKQIVLNSLSCLGESYINEIKELFKKKIICWEGSNTSRSGGYCISGVSTLDENPIKIRWNGDVDAAITLSHELGHNIKTTLTRRQNEINNKTPKIAAEFPAIVNQYLTTFYLLNKYKQEKKSNFLYGIYNDLFKYFIHTVCSHGFEAQYRDTFIRHYLANKKINALNIEKIYLDCKKQYYGISNDYYRKIQNKDVYCDEKLDAYATYIGMERNYYANLVGYYLGSIVGLVVAWKIYNGDKVLLDKYLKFLKTGNAVKPIKCFKIMDIDILKPQVYTESKKIIKQILNDFKKHIKVSD